MFITRLDMAEPEAGLTQNVFTTPNQFIERAFCRLINDENNH